MSSYNENTQFFSKGVVLCQPGLLCTENTFDPMWKTLKSLEQSTTISIVDEILKADSINSIEIERVLRRQRNISKISFFKTLFANPIGRVDDQIEELHSIVVRVKEIFGNDVPVFLVGYSKGGLVNMRYVSVYKGYIKNITSIGTPYENSYLQTILSLSDDVFSNIKIDNMQLFNKVANSFGEWLNEHLSDEDLGSSSFFNSLKKG